MNIRNICLLAVLCALLGACGEAKFKVDGEITGAGGQSIVLEKSDFGGSWIPVDSTKTDKGGKFSISSPAPAAPEIYRLRMGRNYIYLPVDSVENLKLTTSESDFGRKYSLTGSPQAELMTQFEHEVMALSKPDADALSNFKRNVYTKYIQNGQGSILSYYILTKIVDGKPLYDPENPDDAKYYAAVATQFQQYRPDDPHGRMVKEASLQAMRSRNSSLGRKRVIEAGEMKVLEIDLPDASGKNIRLSEVVGKGKPVVVVFSLMNDEKSPAFNRELARIYNSRSGAVEIYQVSFDQGQYEWREAAANLPWINVIDPGGTSSNVLLDYNVGTLPAIFLYDAAGELIDRPESLDALEKKL